MNVPPIDVARAALDRALAGRPGVDGEALTEATKAMCRERDALRRIRSQQATARRRLKDLNALISLVHAAHYPLSARPWDLLEQARTGLDVWTPAET